jgi:hypothetical protein
LPKVACLRFSRALLLMAGVVGCQPQRPDFPDMDVPLAKSVQARAAGTTRQTPREPATLYRDEVALVVDEGLGRFLQRLEVDASLEHGRFEGFRILSLTPPEFWQGVDLRPGDVILDVNGMSIERPPEAHRAFVSLKTAERLVVNYRRGGERRELVYRIKSRPRSVKAAKSPQSDS